MGSDLHSREKRNVQTQGQGCSMLQCAAVCLSVLQCVAVCCSVLQCVAVDVGLTSENVQTQCQGYNEIHNS